MLQKEDDLLVLVMMEVFVCVLEKAVVFVGLELLLTTTIEAWSCMLGLQLTILTGLVAAATREGLVAGVMVLEGNPTSLGMMTVVVDDWVAGLQVRDEVLLV